MSDDLQRAHAVRQGISSRSGTAVAAAEDCSRPLHGPLSTYIPNVVVQTHNFRRALFYDDLLRGKLVLIHCVSVQDRNTWSAIETLVEVQAFWGARFGRDVFISSLPTDAEHDPPQALRGLAEKYGAGDGWLFLPAEPAALELLRDRLFGPAGGHHYSMNLIQYGNVAAGLWGGILATANAESIAERLSWVETGKRQAGDLPQRKGPAPLY